MSSQCLRQIRLRYTCCVGPCASRRFLGYSKSSRSLQSEAPRAAEDRGAESISSGPRRFSPRVHPTVERIIRVNHAGEFGAERIYAGQAAVLGNSSAGSVIQVNVCTLLTFELICYTLHVLHVSFVVFEWPYIGLLSNVKCVYNPAYVGAREGPPGAVQWPGGEEKSEAHCTHTSLEHCWIYARYTYTV